MVLVLAYGEASPAARRGRLFVDFELTGTDADADADASAAAAPFAAAAVVRPRLGVDIAIFLFRPTAAFPRRAR